MNKRHLILAFAVLISAVLSAQTSVYDFTVKDGYGNNVSLAGYKGKVLLIVNTATRCGFTPQYEGLEALYQKYKEQGFVILDFPCNQFMKQAPGSFGDIHSFCTGKYNITFPQFDKIEVNGDNAEPLYRWLKQQQNVENIRWNFDKFLIDRQGNVVSYHKMTVKPAELETEIENLLK
ncbi:MAG: glutathione peroxidase [Paludibacteraceae bacterium]|nr:glutathione peroxidase [Paludibacteraceae bacterium]